MAHRQWARIEARHQIKSNEPLTPPLHENESTCARRRGAITSWQINNYYGSVITLSDSLRCSISITLQQLAIIFVHIIVRFSSGTSLRIRSDLKCLGIKSHQPQMSKYRTCINESFACIIYLSNWICELNDLFLALLPWLHGYCFFNSFIPI